MGIHPTQISQGDNDPTEIDQVVIQLLTSEIPASAKKAKLLSKACIYRVPEVLRNLNKSAYTPRLIAIGPLHRNDQHLQTPMQHVKISYMNNLICRLTPGMENPELAEQKKLMVLRECMAAMKESLDHAKECYAEEVTLDEKMMLIDGCFILEFLYRLYLMCNHSEDFSAQMGADPIFVNSSTLMTIEHDLLLLENQIPFIVLEKLYPLTLARIHNDKLLTDYVVLRGVDNLMRPVKEQSTTRSSPETSCWPRDCILWVSGNKINTSKPEVKVQSEEVVSREEEDSTNIASPKTSCWPRDCIRWVSGDKIYNSKPEEKVPLIDVGSSEQEVSSGNVKRYHHLLHKLHDDYLPQDQKETEQEELTEELPSASDLVYAGVKFIRGTGDDLFKVKLNEPKGLFWWYHRASFEIPFLLVDDSTESVLRNFIAFEQCCPGQSQHFTSYAILIDMLVNYDKDVQVLEKAGVLRNCLGAPKDVTELFNKLSKDVSYGEFFFADTCNRAIRYRKHFWPKNMAYVRRKYFASPWTFIAFCFGFVAFGVTITTFIQGFLT